MTKAEVVKILKEQAGLSTLAVMRREVGARGPQGNIDVFQRYQAVLDLDAGRASKGFRCQQSQSLS